MLELTKRPGYVRDETVEHRPVRLVFRIATELVQLTVRLVLAIELVADEVAYGLRLKILRVFEEGSFDYLENARAKARRGGLWWRLGRVKCRHLPVAPVGLDVTRRDDGYEQERRRDAFPDGPLQRVIALQIVAVTPDAHLRAKR